MFKPGMLDFTDHSGACFCVVKEVKLILCDKVLLSTNYKVIEVKSNRKTLTAAGKINCGKM